MFQAIIKAKTASQLRELRRFNIDFKDHTAHQATDTYLYQVVAIITNEQKQQLESEGYTVEVTSDLKDIARVRLQEVSKVNRFSEVHTMSDLHALTVQGGYMTVDEIETALINLHDIHPHLVKLIELPNKTWEKRTSRAVLIHGGTKSNRSGVIFTGGMHAREWGGSDICINFLNKLIHAYDSNNSVTWGNKSFTAEQVKIIVENIDIIVFPDVNPDGKAYSQATDLPNETQNENVWWRKNRNPNPVPNPLPGGSPDHEAAGVDVNRNFGFLWDSGIGTVQDGKNRPINYRGNEPFSEPESKNVKHLLDTYKNIKCFVDIHCHVGKILMPWGEDETQHLYPEQNFRNAKYDKMRGILCGDDGPDFLYREYMHPSDLHTMVNLATRMRDAITAVRSREYIIEPAVGLYPTSATAQDYAFCQRMQSDEKRSRIFAFTIEFGSGQPGDPENTFIPQYSVMQEIINDICSAITEICFAVSSDDAMLTHHSDSDT
jgi:carboxypeptidase T